MAQTANFNLEKPDPSRDVDEEFLKLQETLDLLDTILFMLLVSVNSKAATIHTHAIGDVIGLASALAGKMPANQTFKLDDLTDVSGADGATINYILVKSSQGWVPSSALAALGTHGHLISEITGLAEVLLSKADGDNTYTKSQVDTTVSGLNTAIGNRALLTTTISAGGLATGGGSLAANRTITVAKSTSAQALAGTDDTTAMTPLRVQEKINASKPDLTLTSVAGSRTLGTVYQNTGSTCRVVTADVANNSMVVNIGPTTAVAARIYCDTQSYSSQFIVPPGWYYKVVGTTLNSWYEGQLG